MQVSKTVASGILLAVVASMTFMAGGGIVNVSAQPSNAPSAGAPGGMQGTVVRDSAVILLEGKTLPGNDFMHLYDTTPYVIKVGHIAAKLPCDASSTSPLDRLQT